MKTAFLAIILVTTAGPALRAGDQFVNVSATATIAGKSYSTPRGTVKSGETIKLTYPAGKSEIVVTAKPTIADGSLSYLIAAKIPAENGASFNEFTSRGSADKSKPVTYEFFLEGQPYSLKVFLSPATREGTPL